jgi:hypothetical protein
MSERTHPEEMAEMSMDDAELGRSIRDHLCAHNQVARYRAELEQAGEAMALLGDNLKRDPLNIRVREAKIILKDDHCEDRTVPRSMLNIARIFDMVENLKQAAETERQLAHRIRENGMGHVVDGLRNRRPPEPGPPA